MAKTKLQLSDLANYLDAQHGQAVILPKVDAPNTTVVGRAQVTDFSKDLRPRMGIERIQVQSIQKLEGEVGPNGEPVYGAVNDIHNRIRFIGNWSNINDGNGQRPQNGDTLEITFYGTGLNILSYMGGSDRGYTIEVDGVGAGSVVITGSAVLGGRNYSQNSVVNIVNGLTLGLHTVKLTRTNDTPVVYGFEILNESTTIDIPEGTVVKGGKAFRNNSLQNIAYNSDFASIERDGSSQGSISTRGGHVLMYGDLEDGQIKKAIVEANSSPAYLGSANHANEEVIRTYNIREFGASRTDDFSTLTTTDDRAFTLDDGTTTLVGDGVRIDNLLDGITETLRSNAAGNFHTLTFVGTGLDVYLGGNNANARSSDIFVDGVSIGTITQPASDSARIHKVVSGLSYGTHTVKFLRAGSFNGIGVADFIIYGPKKPALPANCVEIADYYFMADYVANTVAGAVASSDLGAISTGTLRKSISREFVYVEGGTGTTNWTHSVVDTNWLGAAYVSTDRQNAYFEYTFFGTGFDLRTISDTNRSSSQTVSLNGVALNSSYPGAGSINVSTYGAGINFGGQSADSSYLLSAVANSELDTNNATVTNGGFTVSGLPLGLYTLKVNNNTASTYQLWSAIDVITPIHSPDSQEPMNLQNTLPVGSQAIGDLRGFGDIDSLDIPNWSKVNNITSATTTAGIFVPIADMSTVIKTSGNPIEIIFDAQWYQTVASTVFFAMYVDGALVEEWAINPGASNKQYADTFYHKMPVSKGVHHIQIFWKVTSSIFNSGGMNLTANEVN
jgi:hypothetical protein